MTTTLANLRTSTRIEVRDPDGITFQNADVDYAINQAYRKAFLNIATVCQDYFVTSVNVSIVAGTASYALPSDHLRTKRLEYVTGNIQIPLKRRQRGATVNYTGGVSFNLTNDCPQYDFEGNNLILEPTPLAAVTNGLKHTYYTTASTLTATTDTIKSQFKDMWTDVITLEAAWALFSQVEALGGYVSPDIKERLQDAWKKVRSSAILRTLSPVRRRRKGYF